MQNPDIRFDLQIEHTEEGPLCQVLHAPVGGAESFIELPLDERTLRDFWQQLSTPHQGDPAVMHAQLETARQMGDQLFRAVFPPAIHSCLRHSRDIAYSQRAALPVRLFLNDVSDLTHWPWEYLYDESSREFIAQAIHAPLVRYVPLMHQIRPYTIERPMRLLVVIASPVNYPALHAEREWLTLVDTLDHLARDGYMVLDRLRDPTLFGLQQKLRQQPYHMVHFIGYGTFEEVTGEGLLVFENRMQRSHLVNGRHLGQLLYNYDSVRLAFLDFRQQTASEARNPFVTAAQSLIRRGIPAAVALSHEPSPPAMIPFLDTFYTAMAHIEPIDDAVAHARHAAYEAEQSAAWGAPVCFTRARDARIFHDPAQGPPPSPTDELPPATDNLWLRYLSESFKTAPGKNPPDDR